MPVIGFHSVILRPDSVSRVTPPTTTIVRTKDEDIMSQIPTDLGGSIGISSAFCGGGGTSDFGAVFCAKEGLFASGFLGAFVANPARRLNKVDGRLEKNLLAGIEQHIGRLGHRKKAAALSDCGSSMKGHSKGRDPKSS